MSDQKHTKGIHPEHREKISTEMYLKTIFLLREAHHIDPRPVDLVKELHLTKGSVSEMLKKLADDKYIHYESYGTITLTLKGLKKARNVMKKYLIIKRFLADYLRINPSHVHEEACALEHAFSDESINKLESLLKSEE